MTNASENDHPQQEPPAAPSLRQRRAQMVEEPEPTRLSARLKAAPPKPHEAAPEPPAVETDATRRVDPGAPDAARAPDSDLSAGPPAAPPAGRPRAAQRAFAGREGLLGRAHALYADLRARLGRGAAGPGSPGPGSPARPPTVPPPAARAAPEIPAAPQLEERLRVSLRETSVGSIKRVCVGSPKGGVGKSSVAYALAGSLSYLTNLRVCLVDADPNFGSSRLLVPRPVEHSVVTLAEAADDVHGLSDLRRYVAQNESLRLDVVLGPEHAHEMTRLEDLGEAYARIDAVLSRFYDVIVYDLGLGFRDPAIRRVLSLSDELMFVSDSEIIPNAMLADAIKYVQNLGVKLALTTLVLNHRLPAADESAATPRVRTAHTNMLRRITEIPYDAQMSQLLNRRAFHIEDLSPQTRLGVLTTVAACLEGLRDVGGEGSANEKVVAPAAPAAQAGAARLG